MEYDVFISCKSEDYQYAEEIYLFLQEQDFRVFLASKELRTLGTSEYMKAITNALESTYHLIVFASNPAYIDSSWVEYERNWFLAAKLNGQKQGQLITILKDISIKDINQGLLQFQSISFADFRNEILAYVKTPSYEAQRIKKQEKDVSLIDRILELSTNDRTNIFETVDRLQYAASSNGFNIEKKDFLVFLMSKSQNL